MSVLEQRVPYGFWLIHKDAAIAAAVILDYPISVAVSADPKERWFSTGAWAATFDGVHYAGSLQGHWHEAGSEAGNVGIGTYKIERAQWLKK